MAILSEESSVRRGDRVTVIYKLLNDQSVDETASTAVDVLDFTRVTMLVETAAGTNAGVVTLDGARTASYAGTWEALGNTGALGASEVAAVTLDSTSSPGMPMPFIRARISTAIGVGSVDVYLICQR